MTKPITILHTRVVTGAGGGPDKTILRSAAALTNDRYRIACAYLHPAGDEGINTLRANATRLGTPIHTIPERGPIDLRAVRMLLELCKRLRVDVWHAHDYKTDILGRLLSKRHPMRLISTMHGFTRETWRTRLYAKMSNYALRGYERVIAVSPLLMRHAAEHGVHPDKIRYIPNGIDLTEYARQKTREQAKQSLGISQDEHAIGVVARMSPEKGIDRALQAFADLKQQRPATHLHLIGDGPERRSLEERANQLGLGSAVRWWGWQQDTRPMVEAMDTLLLPSRTEGLPNVILEAMVIGLPVAATSVGAVPGVLDQGACGVLLREDPATWAEAILPLIDRPLDRERLLCNAWVRVREHYDFSLRMQRIESVYDELIGPPNVVQTPLRAAA